LRHLILLRRQRTQAMLDRRRELEEAAAIDEDAAANGVGAAEGGGEGGEVFWIGDCGGSCEIGEGPRVGADIEASVRRRRPNGQVPVMIEARVVFEETEVDRQWGPNLG
jgi:hypothetical protein